jgi:hypothetical protein
MKKPLKYNWYALFSLTFLIMATFFVALTGWRFGSPNHESGPDSAMAGEAAAPDREMSPAGTGDFTADGRARVRADKPEAEELKQSDLDSLSVLVADYDDYWRELSNAEWGVGSDSDRASGGNNADRPEQKPAPDGRKETGPSIAIGSAGKNDDSPARSPGGYQARLDDMTDDQTVPH